MNMTVWRPRISITHTAHHLAQDAKRQRSNRSFSQRYAETVTGNFDAIAQSLTSDDGDQADIADEAEWCPLLALGSRSTSQRLHDDAKWRGMCPRITSWYSRRFPSATAVSHSIAQPVTVES